MDLYVISLADALERRTAITDQLNGLGLPFKFFDACTGAAGYEPFFSDYDPATYKIHSRREALPGEIGCYASHLSLWQLCVEIDRPIIIIEDDAILTEAFPAALRSTAKISAECGFMRLEPNKQSSRRPRRYLPVGKLDEFAVNYVARLSLCMTGYTVSPAAARRLAENSATLLAPVDRYLQRPWSHRQPVYSLAPAAVQQRPRQEGVYKSNIKVGGHGHEKLTLGTLMRIALIKGGYFCKRVWFNATTGRLSRARVRQALRQLTS
jgi:glycosyl transferase family 25